MNETMLPSWLLSKRVVIKNPVVIEYSAILTPYALQFVLNQLSLKNRVRILDESENQCLFSSSGRVITVTVTSCQCAFWTSTHLPCRHIFAVREKRCLSLFCNDLVAT